MAPVNRFFIFGLGVLIFSLPVNATLFRLEWDKGQLPVEIAMGKAPTELISRALETGIVEPKVKLPIQDYMKNGTVRVYSGSEALIYLFVKNTSTKKIRFSVAPHETHPAEHALGFHFNCLCNGHIYEVPPQKTWYRIMHLKNKSTENKAEVKLHHVLFPVRKKSSGEKK